jgi:hypothetical protein
MSPPPAHPAVWVLEGGVFPEAEGAMRRAVVDSGLRAVAWDDAWWSGKNWPRLDGHAVVFHGSLSNADRIRREVAWRPGAYCRTQEFRCSAWYPRASPWLLHRSWVRTTVRDLVSDPGRQFDSISAGDRVFVRPDSPLKPFSGRVVKREALTLEALDHGFYYDDDNLPVVIAPVRSVQREWRYVVVKGRVVAGSAYQADGRRPLPDLPGTEAWSHASQIAAALLPPEEVYVLDTCEADGALHLLELNPFSGADLYACDRPAVVEAVTAAAGAS